MSAIRRLRCRLGIHEWRSGICFYCGKKADSSGVGGSGKGSAAPARVTPARVDETQALAGHAAVCPSPPRPAATPLPSSPADKEGAASQWRPGEVVLDLYEVKEVFESGGMGLVYRVHHRGWNVDLAVKSPRAEQFRTPEHQQRFVHEINAWIGLGLHPHIVSCYYVRTLAGVPRVFAEFVAGGTLAAWIGDRRLYAGGREAAQERLLDVALQIAWGMGHAHGHGAGLVHQDIKPLNVLLTPEGTAKVTDFGLAQARGLVGGQVDPADGRTVCVAGCGLLTPAYASPEQYAQGQGVALSRKSDLWSWAVVVLELYLGGLPWDPRIPGHVALAHGLEGYLKSGAQDPAIPPMPLALQELVRHCLKPNPAERPADFAAVAERLVEIYRNVVGRDYPRVPPVPATLQADALSNRAISMLDLGHDTEAQALFEQALAQEPGHPQATYNWGLVRWRRGEITDLDLVQQLEQALANRPGDWMPPYLLGLVHLERRDAAGAQAALIAAQGLADRAEIRLAQELVKEIPTEAGTCVAALKGHSSGVNAVTVSAGGGRALSGSADKNLRLWDLDRDTCLGAFRGHTHVVYSVALSSDGRRLASGGSDKSVLIWKSNARHPDWKLFGHALGVTSVVLSPDGKRLLSGSADKTLRLWDADRGRRLGVLKGHTDKVSAVAMSPDGRRALSASSDKTLRLWDLDTQECLRTFDGHMNEVTSVAISADGRLALSGSLDQTLRLWALDSGECLRIMKGHSHRISSVAMSADSRWALSGSWDKTLRLWDLGTAQCLRTLNARVEVTSAALSGDGRRAVSGSSGDNTLYLWDTGVCAETDSTIRSPFGVSQVVDAAVLLTAEQQYRDLSAKGDAALTAGQPAQAWALLNQARALPGYRFAPAVLERVHRAGWLGGTRCGLRSVWWRNSLKGHAGIVHAIAFSSDGLRGLSAGEDKGLRVWDIRSGKCLANLKGHTEGVLSVDAGTGRRWALSGGSDNTLRLWDTKRERCVKTLEGHTDWVTSVVVSFVGRQVLSGSQDKTLRLWNLGTERCLKTLAGHDGGIQSVALSRDGRRALSGSGDKTLRLWDLGSGQSIGTLKGHTDQVAAVAITADARQALSASHDQTLRLWDLGRGESVKTLKGHVAEVTCLALSADGRWALSGSLDKTLRLWDLQSGDCLRSLEGHTDAVYSVALSSDGRWALCGGSDNMVHLWELEWDYAFPESQDWDEGARPYLLNFLAQHAPAQMLPGLLRKRTRPTWDTGAWHRLLQTLRDAGYGWLRPEGVRRELNRTADRWPEEHRSR